MEPSDEDPDRTPEFVTAADYVTGVIPLARPGVVVWLGDEAPDPTEVAHAAAMRAHPAGGSRRDTDSPDRHLRAVS